MNEKQFENFIKFSHLSHFQRKSRPNRGRYVRMAMAVGILALGYFAFSSN
jgi:hypothetical protein